MGDAPGKPNPTGLILLASQLLNSPLGHGVPPVAYIGDTVADVLTIKKAKEFIPDQRFISLAIAPPHLHRKESRSKRKAYEKDLKVAGADYILSTIDQVFELTSNWQLSAE